MEWKKVNLVYGIIPNPDNLRGRKAHLFVKKELKKGGSKNISFNNGTSEAGTPDIKVDEKFLEVKTEKDGLKLNQLEWIRKNKDKQTHILFLSNCAVKEKPLHTAIKHNSTFVWNCAEINKMEIKEQKERLRNELEIAKVELEQKEFFVNWLECQIKGLEIKELINGKTN